MLAAQQGEIWRERLEERKRDFFQQFALTGTLSTNQSQIQALPLSFIHNSSPAQAAADSYQWQLHCLPNLELDS